MGCQTSWTELYLLATVLSPSRFQPCKERSDADVTLPLEVFFSEVMGLEEVVEISTWLPGLKGLL